MCPTATAPKNDAANVTVKGTNGYFKNIILEGNASPISLSSGNSFSLPTLTAKFADSGVWPYGKLNVVPSITWTSSDTSVAFIHNGSIVGKNAGTATITGSCQHPGVFRGRLPEGIDAAVFRIPDQIGHAPGRG